MSMAFKKNWNGIPRSVISQYKPNSPYLKPNNPFNPDRFKDPNAFKDRERLDRELRNTNVMRNPHFDFHIPRCLEQPDLTAYSQGNVGN
jgi:hypothetical protein